MNINYPIKFNPILKEKIWGGEKLKTLFNKKSTRNDIGESWEVSDVDGNISIVSNGALKDKSLKFAWLFFGIGLISGSLITSIWFSPKEFIFNIPVERLLFPTQIGMVFFLLLFFNELYKSTIKFNK